MKPHYQISEQVAGKWEEIDGKSKFTLLLEGEGVKQFDNMSEAEFIEACEKMATWIERGYPDGMYRPCDEVFWLLVLSKKHPEVRETIYEKLIKGLKEEHGPCLESLWMDAYTPFEGTISPDIPLELYEIIVENEIHNSLEATFLFHIGKHPFTPPSILERIMEYNFKEDKRLFVEWELEEGHGGYMREGIAQNQNLPLDLLERLARDPLWNVRMAVARRKDLPEHIVDLLTNDAAPAVRKQIKSR